MSDYASFSNKRPSTLERGVTFGVNEAFETGSMSVMSSQKRRFLESITPEDDNSIMTEMIQDGAGSAISIFQGAIMQKQEELLEKTFEKTFLIASGLIAKSKGAEWFKNRFRKGRKASLFSKFLGDNRNDIETARLVADLGKMDISSSANSHGSSVRFSQTQNKLNFEGHEVNKEKNRLHMAKMQLDGLSRAFQWKIETGGFTKSDKPMIKDVMGLTSVTDDYIEKLNAVHKSKVFQDLNGEYVGNAQVNASIMNALGYHRAL